MYDNTHSSLSRIDRLPRRTRRVIAAASLVGLPAMYAWSAFWQTTSVPTALWGPVSFILIGTTAIGAIVLYRFVRNRAEMPGTHLDERQRQLRDRAYLASYAVLSAVVVAVVGWVAIAVLGMGQTIVLDGNTVTALAIVVGTLLPLLPIAALAWIEPDLLPDDLNA